MAVFGYGRVSRPDQSTENQRLELEQRGIALDFWFADVGVSGKSQAWQRPQFQLLLGKIRPGETLVVTKMRAQARFFRGGSSERCCLKFCAISSTL